MWQLQATCQPQISFPAYSVLKTGSLAPWHSCLFFLFFLFFFLSHSFLFCKLLSELLAATIKLHCRVNRKERKFASYPSTSEGRYWRDWSSQGCWKQPEALTSYWKHENRNPLLSKCGTLKWVCKFVRNQLLCYNCPLLTPATIHWDGSRVSCPVFMVVQVRTQPTATENPVF